MNGHQSADIGNINVYRFNLNNIRQSIRLREKKEVRHERELEQLRASELELRKKKSKDRTQRYNKKIRRKFRMRARRIENEVVGNETMMDNNIINDKIVDQVSVQHKNSNDNLHNKRSKKQKKLKMVIVVETS